jgi:hypothetical protein
MLKKALKLSIGLFIIGSSSFAQWSGSTTIDGDIYRNGGIGIGTNLYNGHITLGGMGTHLSIGRSSFPNQVILATGWLGGYGDYTEIRVPGTEPNNVALLRMLHNGSVGIGTTTPTGHLSFGAMGNHLTIGNPGFANQVILATGWNSTNGDYTDLRVPGEAANNALLRIQKNGNVGIGTDNPGSFKLAVEGKIVAREIQVTLQSPFPDYVFASEYKLRSLFSLENYISKNKHLPGIPSAAEVEKEGGIQLGDMNVKLLEKIEELTLYVIELNKKNEEINKKVEKLEKENEALKKGN